MMLCKSKQALIDLQQILQCGKCHENSNSLYLGPCEHWFCRSCAESNAGYTCPKCGVPSVATKTHVDGQLSNVASLCSMMINLINGGTAVGRNGHEFLDSSQNIDNCENYDSVTAESRCEQKKKLKRNEKYGDKNNIEDDGSYLVNKVNQFTSISNLKKPEVKNNEQIQLSDNYEDISGLNNQLQSRSGSDGKRKMFTKVGKRKIDHKLGEDHELFGKNKVKETSNKPGRSNSKILDNVSEDLTPKQKKRRSESFETPEKESKVMKAKKFNARIRNLDEVSSTEKSTPNHRSTPQSTGKCGLKKDLVKNSSGLKLTRQKGTPQSDRKKQNANIEKTNLCKRNAKGETPLQVATIKMDIDEVRRLLDAGANPNVKDNAGWTPLHEAISQGCTGIASILITSGASVNAPGLDNETPLHDAVINQHEESVRLLLANGASVYSRNIHGVTPVDLAQKEEIKSLLMNASSLSMSDMDLPMLDESSKPLCFSGSSLSKGQNKLLIQYTRVLQAKMIDEITPEVTHLIVSKNEDGSCARTMKYLSALLTGKWIVDLQWLDDCCKNEGRIPEHDFQLKGCASCPNSSAPKKALENRLRQLPPLFDGCQIFFYGKFESSGLYKDQLSTLVKLGGGVVLKREPHLHNLDDYPYTRPYHAQNSISLADCTIYKIYDDGCRNPPSVEAQRMSCLPVSWFLDSISTFSLLEKN